MMWSELRPIGYMGVSHPRRRSRRSWQREQHVQRPQVERAPGWKVEQEGGQGPDLTEPGVPGWGSCSPTPSPARGTEELWDSFQQGSRPVSERAGLLVSGSRRCLQACPAPTQMRCARLGRVGIRNSSHVLCAW